MTAQTLRPGAAVAPARSVPRVVVAWTGLVLVGLAVSVLSLGTGEYVIAPADVVRTLLGDGTQSQSFIVETLRLPRVLCALFVGGALGLSGAVFQTLTRNPLGSPDVIGFTWGAAAFAVLQIAVLGGGAFAVSGSAIVGGIVTAVAVYGLALGGTGVHNGGRMILIGIGMNSLLAAVTTFIVARADLGAAQAARIWLTGSLNGRGWEFAVPLMISLAILVPALAALSRSLRMLELGDDAATGLGVRIASVRPMLIVVAVALCGVATAAAGPIPFVALAAPQLARRLTRATGPGLIGAGLMGAVLLAASDLLAQRLLPSTGLPVGVMTGALGGAYLIWLLHHEWRHATIRHPPTTTSERSRLEGQALELAYDRRVVSQDLSIRIPDGSFTVIVGPNACGKSTALRALARMLKPRRGHVLLDGADITSRPAKEVARKLGLLPQSSVVPDGITVRDLVGRGRFPHQGLLRQWSAADSAAVQHALDSAHVAELADRFVDELSGGQRQRVWLAMVLAQETELLLLDEPTTYLDLAHQVEVLDLCADLHEQHGRTLVAVLHDVSQAARYATHLIAMKDGRIVAEGDPADIVTAELIEAVYGLACLVVPDPVTGTPLVVPRARRRALGTDHVAARVGQPEV